jgi:hypothetical protein
MISNRLLNIGVSLALTFVVGPPLAAAQGAAAPTAADEARDLNLSAYTELLRSDIRVQKAAIIAEVMQFSEADDAKFWPIYRQYEAELAKINGDRLALISEYAESYDTLTDATADRLALRALDLEDQRQALKVKYYNQLKAEPPPKTVVRFLQVENQILLLLDLQIAASLPIVK